MISTKIFSVLFISASLFLSTNALLSIPVKFDYQKNSILFNATFGTEECKIDTKAEFFYCNNDIDFIRTGSHQLQTCGAVKTGTHISGLTNYVANFQMGNFQAKVVFAEYNSPDIQNVTYYTKSLCFGKVTNDRQQLSLVKQLNEQGLISEPKVFITFFNNYLSQFTKDDIIGQINLGQPNPDFIKKGSNFVKMFVNNSDYYQLNCNFYSNGETTFFGQKISGYLRYYIDFDDPESTIDTDTFNEMLDILQSKNYKITKSKLTIFPQYYLDTIEGLEPIKITILTEDMSPYILTIDPSVYTQKIAKGVYKLLFQPRSNNQAYTIGNRILASYYFGYDASTQNTFFAERVLDINSKVVDQKVEIFSQNFRSEKI
ncbi:transmembrane protein, putative (macronuclear) [Tetrahymena thermophila SB210]|uniref:Transmembrane protein, putative n=1 Tax=Tetrahymena thermophila (strain SB210) TaxID=312017 RepID=Q24C66_TETTS|nr:transmembrane protein, putative [Tetrahymena thermophila SB210]EAS05372.1 transmembrane protein, putative [Tetrahymena thermophila SB210]|eukprot:XP_001025617.1 transmembrane protein, putative [Tetrahymena thermophila SB210]